MSLSFSSNVCRSWVALKLLGRNERQIEMGVYDIMHVPISFSSMSIRHNRHSTATDSEGSVPPLVYGDQEPFKGTGGEMKGVCPCCLPLLLFEDLEFSSGLQPSAENCGLMRRLAALLDVLPLQIPALRHSSTDESSGQHSAAQRSGAARTPLSRRGPIPYVKLCGLRLPDTLTPAVDEPHEAQVVSASDSRVPRALMLLQAGVICLAIRVGEHCEKRQRLLIRTTRRPCMDPPAAAFRDGAGSVGPLQQTEHEHHTSGLTPSQFRTKHHGLRLVPAPVSGF